MRHSIVTWDSSFRSFFHLLPALAAQDFDLAMVEVVLIEQRSRKTALQVAAASGVRPAEAVCEAIADRLAVDLVYLDEPDAVPYHPGRLLNVGLARASGEILSTMDVDLLVPRNFLAVLDWMHAEGDCIATLHRYDAAYPCGVTVADWTRQLIDHELILNTTLNRATPIPPTVANKAPLLSTRRAHWQAIGGYDDHPLFATAYTLFGRDISARLEILLGKKELPMPVAAVHPWHPREMQRQAATFQVLYQAQSALIGWSVEHKKPDHAARREVAERLMTQYRPQITEAIRTAEAQMLANARAPRPRPAA